MSGNSFGQNFVVTSFGESHGPAIGCIIDGCPPNLPITEKEIEIELERRKTGKSQYTSQRREPDNVEILSGVFENKTTGTPIALLIRNQDHKSKDYDNIKNLFRPGHGDYSYFKKYGIRDYRGGGRSSARETVARVAAGAIAKKYLLENFKLEINGCVTQIGNININNLNWDSVNTNPFFSPDENIISKWEDLIKKIRKDGNSIGAKCHIKASNIPLGLGEPVFNKLDADIAHAMMGINAVKGVEIGAGFDVVSQLGSEHRDEITPNGFLSNNAGGILAGISTGQDILVNIALKPASSILKSGQTIDTKNQKTEVVTKGRHDPCVGIRAVPIAEAMLALVLMDHVLRHRAQCG